MSLRRGTPRVSCNFCQRRKIKCNRNLRLIQGHQTCSACALRQIVCELEGAQSISANLINRAPDARYIVSMSPLAEAYSHSVSQNSARQLTLDQMGKDRSAARDLTTVSNMIQLELDNHNQMSSENSLFLDYVFSAGEEDAPSAMDADPFMMHEPNDTQHSHALCDLQGHAEISHNGIGDSGDCAMRDRTIFEEALRAYFSHADPLLPVLVEEAFWKDYRDQKCSQSLAYAVACHGVPFTRARDKRSLQRQWACSFRESFLASVSQGTPRLDDLEALALMINVPNENSSTIIGQHMDTMLFSHESLVLMLVRARLQNFSRNDTEKCTLAMFEERRTLLYWHVYGTDAFYCLDKGVPSRLAGTDLQLALLLPHKADTRYVDSILSLAIVARKLNSSILVACDQTQEMQNATIRRSYDMLEEWRHNRWPAHLRIDEEKSSDIAVVDAARSIALSLLYANCSMQVEKWFSNRTQVQDNLNNEMVSLSIRVESLRAVSIGISAAQSLLLLQKRSLTAAQDARLVPLGTPSFVRDIIAGICIWLCQRGQHLLARGGSEAQESSDAVSVSFKTDAPPQRVVDYVQKARQMCDAVAVTTHHYDNEQVVVYLEEQVAGLKFALECR